MIFLKINNNNRVVFRHHKPFDKVRGLGKTKEELEQEGIFVDSIPEPENMEGKLSVMYYSQDKGIYYEYEDISKTEDEKQEVLTQAVAQLNIDSAKKDAQIQALVQTVTRLNIEIAQLKGGSN